LHAQKKPPVKDGSVFVSIQRVSDLECQTSR
jgi:hypothetical protein